MLRDAPQDRPLLSLAQGIVHWDPPPQALDRAAEAVRLPQTSAYGPDDGMPELKARLQTKISEENGLVNSQVMVTTGANQAFMNVVLSLLDAGDAAVLFKPYYFNHIMALQMAGTAASPEREILFGSVDPNTLQPDPAALEALLAEREQEAAGAGGAGAGGAGAGGAGGAGPAPVKMVVLCSPCNPTGVVVPKE
eukprot:g5920.t1